MSPFIKVSSKYCHKCGKESLSVITNGNKNNPIIISYICKNCGEKYLINWSDYKNPRPLYIDPMILMRIMK